MKNLTVKEEIDKILEKNLNREIGETTKETNFERDLKMDSLDNVEMIMDIEEYFDIEISDEDAKRMNTIGDLIDFIEKNRIE